jgi:hypothetical protein
MVKRQRPPQWHLIFTGIGLFAAVVVAVTISHLPPQTTVAGDPARLQNLRPPANLQVDADTFADGINARLDSVLAELGIAPAWIDRRRSAAGVDTIGVRVPADLPIASVNQLLTDFVSWQGGHVVRGAERRGPAAVDLTCGIDSTVTTLFRLRRDRRLTRSTGRIAIVVDVRRAPAGRVQRLAELTQRLTLAAGDDAAVATPDLAVGDHQLIARMPEITESIDAEGVTADDVNRHLWALAVAHLRPATLSALEEMLPRLERRGYHFVTLAEFDN